MKNIQELKTWVEDQVGNAQERANHYEATGDTNRFITMSSRRSAFSEMLLELNLLLKEETAKDLPLVCYTCKVTKGKNEIGNNFCSLCDHYF